MDPLEVQLNQAKDQLEQVEFETLKRSDPYESRIYELRSRLGHAQHVTKAWLKMYEMIATTTLGRYLLEMPSPIRAFFNAELPGAFVFATNHFLKTYGKDLQFVVSSYYPKSQQGDFLGDQFGLLENNPDKALVGLIHTTRGDFWSDGDLTNPKVPRILAQLARAKLGQVDLYTADGGFGVEKRENLQERLSLPLIRGEIQTGFLALRPGGALLLKIFTYFTPEMLRYLEIIKRSFRSFDIVKPSTSAPMNSELYVIGIDYLGNGDVDMTVDSISPDIIEKRTQFVQSQIRELRSFVSGEGQTIPTFSPDWVAPISSDKQI